MMKIAGFIGALALSTVGFAITPPYVHIVGITHGGTGCPAGTVAGTISPDLDTFTLIFDQFMAQTGPGLMPSASRQFCQVNVNLDFPQGWSYSLFDVTYRGYAAIAAGAMGVQRSTYYFTGSRLDYPFQSVFYGPMAGDYIRTDSLGISALVWSPCGARAPLNIKSEARISPPFTWNQSLLTVDSIDGHVQQIYGVQWRRCY